MSVASRNPFALLDEDSAPASTTPQKKAPEPAQAPQKDAQKNRSTPASRGGKYYNRGGKPNTVRDTNAAPADEPVEGQRKFDGPPRGRGRGRGGRGDGRGRGGDRPSRGRQFDRHSATGKVDTDKQTHQGWGGDEGQQELQVEEQAENDANAEVAAAAAATGDEPAEGEARQDRPARREREPEEDDNTLTLDQYLAQKKESEIVPKLTTTRQANEGVDDAAWKNTVPLTKNEEEENYFIGKTKSAPKSRAKKEEKVYLEIDARFDRPSRGRGGDRGAPRGGRGGNRGGRGGYRGSNGGSAAALNVEDERAFPSLS